MTAKELAQRELVDAITYLRQRKINIGRINDVVRATRKVDAATVRELTIADFPEDVREIVAGHLDPDLDIKEQI